MNGNKLTSEDSRKLIEYRQKRKSSSNILLDLLLPWTRTQTLLSNNISFKSSRRKPFKTLDFTVKRLFPRLTASNGRTLTLH